MASSFATALLAVVALLFPLSAQGFEYEYDAPHCIDDNIVRIGRRRAGTEDEGQYVLGGTYFDAYEITRCRARRGQPTPRHDASSSSSRAHASRGPLRPPCPAKELWHSHPPSEAITYNAPVKVGLHPPPAV